MQRCCNPTNKDFWRYGGHKKNPITVCKRWLKFKNFRDDMLPTWKKGLTLERVNNDLGYFKENCRWATRKEQRYNQKTPKNVKRIKNSIGQVFNSQMEASRKTGIKQGHISLNLNGYRKSAGKDKDGNKIKWFYL